MKELVITSCFSSKQKHQKSKFESAYPGKPKIAISGTKHTVTTPNGGIIHGKCISKPITDFDQDCNNKKGNGPRASDGRFTKSSSNQKKVFIIESDNALDTPPPERSSPTVQEQPDNASVKKSTFDRGRPKLIIDR